MKHTHGVNIGQGVISHRDGVAAGAPRSLRKIRCPYCQRMVAPSQDNQGRNVAKCVCGRTFSSTKF
jgi:hypothetical protein